MYSDQTKLNKLKFHKISASLNVLLFIPSLCLDVYVMSDITCCNYI